jgi:Protein of unknown function (DUF1682)
MSFMFLIDIIKYNYELMWSGLLLVAVTVFFTGKSKNDNIAKTWKKAVSEIISQNFAHFGFDKEPSANL